MPSASALLLLFLFVGMGLVGFLDDFIKIVQAAQPGAAQQGQDGRPDRDRRGLRHPRALAGARGRPRQRTPASQHLSFIRDFDSFALPAVLVILLIWLIITGTSNAVNLTDGLDGLATGACVMVFGAYTLVNIWQNNQSCRISPSATCYEVRDPLDLAVVAAAITGACFGFLWWNASPAAIFMGDTGSLSLGGALAGFAILTRTEMLLVLLGGLFLVETLSVMLQVGFFKLRADRGKRIFRMAPLHHHFEMLGWEQVTVVIRFWIITGLASPPASGSSTPSGSAGS